MTSPRAPDSLLEKFGIKVVLDPTLKPGEWYLTVAKPKPEAAKCCLHGETCPKPPSEKFVSSCKGNPNQTFCDDPNCGNRDPLGYHWPAGHPMNKSHSPAPEAPELAGNEKYREEYVVQFSSHGDDHEASIDLECLARALEPYLKQARAGKGER